MLLKTQNSPSAQRLQTSPFTRTIRRNMSAVLLLIILKAVFADTSTIHITSDTDVASAGFYSLSWQDANDAATNFTLQETQDPAFQQPTTLYSGADTSYAMSGKENGDYYYRVAETTSDISDSSWSLPVKVTVAHHSRLKAFSFFIAGAVIFIATLMLIFSGARNTRNNAFYD